MQSFKNKIKLSNKFIAAFLLAITLSLAAFSLSSKKASATSIPLCQPPQLASNGGAASLCFDSTGKSYYPVGDNADKNPNPEDDHCYTVRSTAFGLVYFNANCNQAPFNSAVVISCNDGTNVVGDKTTDQAATCNGHGGVRNGAIPLKIDCNAAVLNRNNCGIIWYLQLFINVLAGLVGIVIVIVITVAGIQWSTAGSNPQQVANAKTRLFNALVALALFIFMYAFLQWVVPGGVL